MTQYSLPAPASLILSVSLVCYAFVILKHGFTVWLLQRFWNCEEVRVRGRVLTLVFFGGYLGGETLLTAMACAGRNFPSEGFKSTAVRDWNAAIWLGVVLLPYGISLLMGPLVLKSVVLMFNLEIAREQLSLVDVKKDAGGTSSPQWFSSHRFWISEKNQLRAIIVWTLLCFVPFMGLFVATRSQVSGVIWILEGVFLSLMFACCGKLISRSQMDFWKIKEEIYFYVIGWSLTFAICGSITYLTWNVVQNVHNTWKLLFLFLCIWFSSQFILCPVTLRPFLRLLQQERQSKGRMSAKFSTDDFAFGGPGHSRHLESKHEKSVHEENAFPEFFSKHKENMFFQLLNRPDFEDAFKKHLASEFSLENLLFLVEVRRLYEKCAEVHALSLVKVESEAVEKVLLQAVQISEMFLYENSLSALNISSEIRDKAIRRIETFLEEFRSEPLLSKLLVDASQVFLPAANEVFYVMQNDSFARFKTTKAYEVLHSKHMAIVVVEAEKQKDFSI